jgi:hypothetical protein
VTFLVVWLAHGYIYRWRQTRLSDEGIDAALTRFAWPAYLWRRRLARRAVRKPSIVSRITEVRPDD